MTCLASGSVLRDAEGRAEGYSGIVHDITEQRRAAEALARSETRFRDISYSMADWIWETDPTGRITHFSGATEDPLGFAPEELIGKSASDLLSEEEAPVVAAAFAAFVAAKQPFRDLESWPISRRGAKVGVLTSGTPILGPDGEFLGYRGVLRDVTAQRKLEEDAHRAERMDTVGRVMAGLAHDFKNILAVIQATAETFCVTLPREEEELLADAEELRAAALRGATLVRKLLTFGRERELDPKPVRLDKVVRSFASTLRRFIPEHIAIEVNDGGALPPALADVHAVEQILLNLASNARDAMPSGGTLTVSLSREAQHPDHPGDFLRLAVADTGHGMEEDVRDRIFEAFFTTRGAERGTGLGLCVVQRLAGELGGFVQVESVPGTGSTFSIYLPVADVPQAAVAEAVDMEDEIPVGAGESILVVEDEPALRRATRRTLERLGYAVVEAPDGMEALRIFQEMERNPRLIVTDVVMPKLGGPGLFRELRRQNHTVDFLFTSGHALADIDELMSFGGGFTFLEKPWDVGEFARTVRRALDGSGAA